MAAPKGKKSCTRLDARLIADQEMQPKSCGTQVWPLLWELSLFWFPQDHWKISYVLNPVINFEIKLLIPLYCCPQHNMKNKITVYIFCEVVPMFLCFWWLKTINERISIKFSQFERNRLITKCLMKSLAIIFICQKHKTMFAAAQYCCWSSTRIGIIFIKNAYIKTYWLVNILICVSCRKKGSLPF